MIRVTLLTTLTTIFGCLTFAQQPIVFQSADAPTVPWNHRIAVDTFPLPAVNFGPKGANQVYDFSNLQLFKYDTVEYRALTSQQASKFPNANQAITNDGITFLFTRFNPNVNIIGEGLEGELIPGLYTDVQFSPKPEATRFPTQFGGTFGGNWGFTKIVPGSSVGQPSLANVRVRFTSNYTDTVDGWGKVITPLGAYKCLRVKRTEQTRTIIDASVQPFPNLYSIQVSDTRDTTIRYSYLTKEAKGSVITFTFDSLDNVTSASWSMIPPAPPVANFSFGVGPNGQVSFTDNSDGYPTSWSWNYGDGSPAGTQQNPSKTYAANGNYYVCLTATNAGGSNTFCDTVRVTTIASVNQKPIAKDDSTTCFQGDSVEIFPLTNDTDPDFNALTITNVYNPQNGVATLSGTKVTYKPNSAFTGWDFFDYRICDNGSPVLCDTGRVFVQVIPKPANQKPIAKDDSAQCQQPNNVFINVLTNDTDPDNDPLTVAAVFNFQNGTATTNGFSVNYQPNAGFSGWDFFDYRVCDNGSPSLCDTGRVFVEVFPLPPSPPVADFNYAPNSGSSTCGFAFSSTAQNADSIVWKFYDLVPGGKDSVIINQNNVDYGVNGFAFNQRVCLYAFNSVGVDSACVTATTACVGIQSINEFSYKMFPNPANDEVFLSFENNILTGNEMVRIYDVAGRLITEVRAQNAIANVFQIGTANLQTGSYVLEIVSPTLKTLGRSRLMIQR